MSYLKNVLSNNAIYLVIGVLAALVVVSVTDQAVLALFVILVCIAVAVLLILAKSGLVTPLLLLGLGFSLIINPNKTFEDPENFFGYSGAMYYYIALQDMILVLLVAIMASPKKIVRYQPGVRLNGRFPVIIMSVYLGWTLLTVFLAENSAVGFTQWLYEIRQAVLFLFMGVMLARLPRPEMESAIRLITLGLAGGIFCEALLVICEYVGLLTDFSFMGLRVKSFDETLGGTVIRRVGGTYMHPNALSMPMAVLLPFLAVKAIDNREHKLFRLVLAGAALCAALCLILTLSRGAMLGLAGAVGLGGLLFLTVSGSMTFVRKHLRYFVLGGIGVVILGLIFSGPIVRKFTESDPENVISRLNLNKMSEEIIAEYPLAGVGLNNANVVGPKYSYYRTYEMIFKIPPVVHNIYLLVASEIGLVGVGLWLLFIFSVLATGARALYVKGLEMRDKLLLLALIIGMLNFLISDLVGYSLRVLEVGFLSWWILGLLLAVAKTVLNRPYVVEAPGNTADKAGAPNGTGPTKNLP